MTAPERYIIHGRTFIYGAVLLAWNGTDPIHVLILIGLGIMATLYGVFAPPQQPAAEEEPPSGIEVVEGFTVVPDGSRGGVG